MSQNSKPRWQGSNKPPENPLRFVIESRQFDRVPFGDWDEDPDLPKCQHCGAVSGEFHLIGCDKEPCPRCGGQAISCECSYEGD